MPHLWLIGEQDGIISGGLVVAAYDLSSVGVEEWELLGFGPESDDDKRFDCKDGKNESGVTQRADDAGWISCRDDVGRNIAGNNTSGAND